MAQMRAIVSALVAGAAVLTAWAAAAQKSSQTPTGGSDPLKNICTAFLDQSGQKVGGDANRLCTCLVRETKSRLTDAEMKAYSAATTNGQAPPDVVLQKVLAIAQTCLSEAG